MRKTPTAAPVEATPEPIAEPERKSFFGLELKADKPGAFTAVIATLNVVDKQGDVTLPGAAPQGKSVLVSAYMHGSWDTGKSALPVGKGVIREEGDRIFLDGAFNLNTDTGREHYETVKFAPELQEWSYGYRVLAVDEENPWNDNPKVYRVLKTLDIFEASPVLRGAGVNTGTPFIKSDKEGVTYTEQSEAALAAVKGWAERTGSLADLKRKDGRVLSPANKERVTKVLAEVEAVAAEIKSLLAEPELPDQAAVEAVFLAYHKLNLKSMEVC